MSLLHCNLVMQCGEFLTEVPSCPMSAAARLCRLRKEVVLYQQAFSAGGARLCLVCLAPVPHCAHPPGALLPGGMDLFCGCAVFRPGSPSHGFTMQCTDTGSNSVPGTEHPPDALLSAAWTPSAGALSLWSLLCS